MAIGCIASLTSVAYSQPNLSAMAKLNPRMPPPMELDVEKIEALGLRKLSGQYLDLYTDIPEDQTIDELVNVFDQAVPQWCDLFDIPPAKTRVWKISAFLMRDLDRFREAGCLPADLPDFPTGFNLGHHFWVIEQPGNYYTRHLILHEGTHAFMQWFLGGSGPPWYSEGMAEKMGLHRFQDGRLELNARLTSAAECEYWGRPKFIDTARSRQQRLSLDEIFDLRTIQFQDVGGYAWSWAACEFFSSHPLTSDPFTRMRAQAENRTPGFSLKFKGQLRNRWSTIERDWQLYIDELTYGSTAARATIQPADVLDEGAGRSVVSVDAAHSWQTTGWSVREGETWSFEASGRFVVREDSGPIWSEPPGITVHYYQGRPVGSLMVAVLNPDGEVVAPTEIGAGRALTASQDGEWLLRINENPADMDDNSGRLTVSGRKVD